MLPALLDENRQTLSRLAFACFSVGAVLLPLATESSFGVRAAEPLANAARENARDIPMATTYKVFTVNKDPFVADAGSNEETPVADPSVGQHVREGDPIDEVSGQSGVPIVRAIVLGPQVRALVEAAGKVETLGKGDRLGGSTIVAIDRGGIVLANGRRLTIDGAPQ